LRTPIATLLTHIEILGLDDVGDDVHTQSLQLAKREAQRMSRLVNDMLELGRLEMTETLTRRPLSLLALVEDVVAQTMPRAVAENVTVDIVSPPALPLVLGNTDRLRQVLLNLLDNAFKYAGAGSRATIELSAATAGVVCTICDTGPGIPPEHLPFVTQRFYRAAAETVEGSGLGLALVAEILRHHGSELEITSSVADDTGTCARFVLPPAGPTGGE
ncbi:MAG: HAMP domain-containing histidine kinase, partial [Anaerolineae bacterium]|nr:HAMP domain-containing histidine kinase [Anaerolineae bacterium]